MWLQSGLLIFFFQIKIHPYQKCRHLSLTKAVCFQKAMHFRAKLLERSLGEGIYRLRSFLLIYQLLCHFSLGGERALSMVLYAFLSYRLGTFSFFRMGSWEGELTQLCHLCPPHKDLLWAGGLLGVV